MDDGENGSAAYTAAIPTRSREEIFPLPIEAGDYSANSCRCRAEPGRPEKISVARVGCPGALVDGTDQIEPAGRHRLLETAIVISVLRPTVADVWPEGLNHLVDRDKR